MADFCLDCWNKLNETHHKKSKYILSKERYFCEECNEFKNVIVVGRKGYYLHKFRYLLLPFRIIWIILTLPYRLYWYVKSKDNVKEKVGFELFSDE